MNRLRFLFVISAICVLRGIAQPLLAKGDTPSSGLEDPFRFGYPAVVYTLALSESRSSLREWGKYRGLGFRLELRTMLQEAWATISPRVNLNVDSISEKKLKRRSPSSPRCCPCPPTSG